MSLEGVAVIAELTGAIGVIASLIYLATQIRQAKDVARAENVRDVQESFRRFTRMLAEDGEAAEIWRTGLNDRSDLSAIQQTRFDFMTGEHVLAFIDLESAYRSGFLDRFLYERWLAWVAAILNSPGATEWWVSARSIYSEDIVALLDRAREQSPAVTDLPSLSPLTREGLHPDAVE